MNSFPTPCSPRNDIWTQAVRNAHRLRDEAMDDAVRSGALSALRGLNWLINRAELAVHRGIDRLSA
jgi:hypothetical protein